MSMSIVTAEQIHLRVMRRLEGVNAAYQNFMEKGRGYTEGFLSGRSRWNLLNFLGVRYIAAKKALEAMSGREDARYAAVHPTGSDHIVLSGGGGGLEIGPLLQQEQDSEVYAVREIPEGYVLEQRITGLAPRSLRIPKSVLNLLL